MRMLTLLVLALLLTANAPAAAQGGSASLTWEACAGDGGALLKTFACDTNSGADELVCSVYAPAGVDSLVGVEAVIEIVVCGQASWWQLRNAGACRATALTLDPTPPDNALACADPWQGLALGATAYDLQYNSNYDYSVGRLRVAVAIPTAAAVPAIEGNEYFLFRVRLNHQKAVGSVTCSGCANSAALYPSLVRLIQPAAGSEVSIYAISDGPASWQSPGAGGCIPDAVRGTTWGAVKALYR